MKQLLVGWLFVVAAPWVSAQVPPTELKPAQVAAVDEAVRGWMEKEKAVGVAVGVIADGQVAYLKGYGLADREKNEPVTAKTMFRWASVSKPVTAVATLQLVEKGLLDLDADVRQYVPEYPDHRVKITARQLLCHQGGIVHYANGKVIETKRDYDVPHPFADVVLALDKFQESPLVNKPGEKFSYTTHGYILLSAVVQRAGKLSFAEQVQERICRPLRMASFQPDYQWVEIPHRAVGYRKRGDEVVPSTNTDVSWKLGGGGFISNIDDMARFAAGLINRKLVNEKTEALMWTPQKTSNGQATDYALGFNVTIDAQGRRRVSHSGGQEKTRTYLTIMPREKSGVVVMTNSEYANPQSLVSAIRAALNP